MEFKHLEAFAQVVKMGSFSKAADALYLTQPTVSAHIASLEKEVGGQLIVRTPKAVYPSELGQGLFEYALEMLSLREQAVLSCQTYLQDMRGSIDIAVSSLPYRHILPVLMSEFRQSHPHVRFHVTSSDSEGVVSSILEGKATLGISGSIFKAVQCKYQSFHNDYLVVITPNSAQYQNMDSFTLQDLRRQPLIVREPGSGTRQEFERYLQQKGLSLNKLNIVAQLDDPDAIKNSVCQGLGISVLSMLSAEADAQLGRVKIFHLDGAPIERKMYFVTHRSRPLPRLCADFMAHSMKRYASDHAFDEQAVKQAI